MMGLEMISSTKTTSLEINMVRQRKIQGSSQEDVKNCWYKSEDEEETVQKDELHGLPSAPCV